MPKFVITTKNEASGRHSEALEFKDQKAATDDAQVALAEMAKDALPNGKKADFEAAVSDDQGGEVYRASLKFKSSTPDQGEAE